MTAGQAVTLTLIAVIVVLGLMEASCTVECNRIASQAIVLHQQSDWIQARCKSE